MGVAAKTAILHLSAGFYCSSASKRAKQHRYLYQTRAYETGIREIKKQITGLGSMETFAGEIRGQKEEEKYLAAM